MLGPRQLRKHGERGLKKKEVQLSPLWVFGCEGMDGTRVAFTKIGVGGLGSIIYIYIFFYGTQTSYSVLYHQF